MTTLFYTLRQAQIIVFNAKISVNLYKNIKTGVAGFEPTNGGVKVHSLTTWRHPNNLKR